MEEEILNKRWKDVDKLLSKYNKDYKKLNKKTQDKLQDVFNLIKVPYEGINKPISKEEKARLDRFILELQESGLLSDYFGYRARLILKKKKVTYSEMLRIMIEGCYIQENKELDEINNLLYYEIADNAYAQGIKEAGLLKPIHLHIPFETMYLLLNIPLLEATAEAYMMALELNNAEELYKRALTILQQGKGLNIYSKELQELIKKQQKKLINMREEGQPTGAMSNITDNLVNEAYLQVAKDNNIQKVRFIAEMDERTTRMCKSLNGQIFNVQAENSFWRYFGYDYKHLVYKKMTCYGLVKGLNMPPIDNHFHYCRSTLTYLIDKFIKTADNIFLDNFFLDSKGVMHPIDGKEKLEKVDVNSKEYKFAVEFKKKFGGDLHMVPRILDDKGNKKSVSISTPDYIWNNEKWDLKDITGNGQRTIEDAIKKKEKQAHNFILRLDGSDMSNDEIIRQYNKIFKSDSTNFVEKVIIYKNDKIFISNIDI